jgi:ubiquinone/menaquinone biosynthesis C-methylase UbiE
MGGSSGFADHFSGCAEGYAEFRPGYPDELFELLASLAPSRRLAWDCATGSGQAAVPLAARFERVVASDASPAQIAEAQQHPSIEYHVGRAEESGLPDASCDLVTVAQALHWFDVDVFHAEAVRVLVPDGLLAEWSYGPLALDAPLDAVMRVFYAETVGPYWPKERAHVDAGYRDLPFPLPRLPMPDLALKAEMTLAALLGYVSTWSAVQAFRAAEGKDPLPQLQQELQALWGPAGRTHHVRWPLVLRVGRKPRETAPPPSS